MMMNRKHKDKSHQFPIYPETFWVNYLHLFSDLFLIFFLVFPIQANCTGRFVNPITDICWSCLFPITIGGVSVSTSGEDTPNPQMPVCTCPMPIPPYQRIGFPISFWEPARLVDVTRTP